MGKLVRRTIDGDTVVAQWSPDDAGSLSSAVEAMRREQGNGYMAVRWSSDANEPVEELDPQADLIVLTMPMGGG